MTPNFNLFVESILNSFIKESVTFSIAEETPNVNDLLGLSNSILYSKELSDYIDKILSSSEKEEWMKSRPTYDFLTPDGKDFDKQEGILNFYTGGLSSENVQKLLKFLKYYISEYNGEVIGEIREDNSKIYKSKVFRIPVRIKEKISNPPELNISNMNARTILSDVLNYPDDTIEYYEPLNARDLLMKIESVEENLFHLQKASREDKAEDNVFIKGLSTERIKTLLAKLKEIAEYALNNNYTFVSLS